MVIFLLIYTVLFDLQIYFRFAQNLLAEKMNANEDALANFFGNVVKFLPLSTTEFIVIGENEKNFARFEVSGGQIVDISVDKLV